MARRRFTTERSSLKLRDAEVGLAQASSWGLRRCVGHTLSKIALWIVPDLHSGTSTVIAPEKEIKLLPAAPLDPDALLEGRVKVRYLALDPVWREETSGSGWMIPLREHIKRLHSVAYELSYHSVSGEWHVVSEHLSLAASLRDLSADTDIYNTSMWCRDAADFEDANSEVVEKHLAGVIVFTLVWAAYEAAVKVASEPFPGNLPDGMGARGREILKQLMGNKHFPYLRQTVFGALKLHNGRAIIDPDSDTMRSLIAAECIAAIGAEHLRCFRNAVAHGDIAKPEPGDWGERSAYNADDDPAIRQFHDNIASYCS